MKRRWFLVMSTFHLVCLITHSQITRRANQGILPNLPRYVDIRSSVPAGLGDNKTRLALKLELFTCLRKDREKRLSKLAAGIESTAASGKFRKLFHPTRFAEAKERSTELNCRGGE